VTPLKKFTIAYFILTALDVITTTIALQTSNVSEHNPFMNSVVHNLPLLIIVKLIAFVIVIRLTKWTYHKSPKLSVWGMIIIVIMYIAIVMNNLYWIVIST